MPTRMVFKLLVMFKAWMIHFKGKADVSLRTDILMFRGTLALCVPPGIRPDFHYRTVMMKTFRRDLNLLRGNHMSVNHLSLII